MLAALVACYSPPDLPLQGTVPIVAAPPPGCRDPDDVTIDCTLDGDTFDIDACGIGERYRMLGTDAPEIEHPGQAEECYAQEAWDWLTDLVQGETVTVSFDRDCETEVFTSNRTLAYVWLRGDLLDKVYGDPELEPYLWVWFEDQEEPAVLVNEVMLGEGLARQYPEEIAGTLIFQSRLDDAARSAEQFGRGLYGACSGG